MRNDGQFDARRQMTQHVDCGGTRVNKDGITIAQLARCQLADEIFGSRIESGANRKRHDILRRNRRDAAVYLGDVAACFQLIQIAPNGVFGYAEHFAKIINGDCLFG